jgi:hypothetical protein
MNRSSRGFSNHITPNIHADRWLKEVIDGLAKGQVNMDTHGIEDV